MATPEQATAALAAVSDAVLGVAGDRSVTTVLERLAAAAQQLVDARYAAIGVPDDEGDGFAQFIHVGMSDELVDAIGPLPRTHGLLGSCSWPTRSPTAPTTCGPTPVSPGGPPPIPGCGRSWACRSSSRATWWAPSTWPTRRAGGEFTDDDESLIGLLAANAAIAIENARLYERSRELSIVEERNRIALELHDATAQTLFSIRLAADTALGFMGTDPDRAAAELATVRELAGAATGELRSLIFALRPASVAEDGLVVALRKHLDLIGRTHRLGVRLVADEVGDLPADVEADLYRVAQEALTNVVRHASASDVEVTVARTPDGVTLTVADDGAGFDPRARAIRAHRLGLTSMAARTARHGGSTRVESVSRARDTLVTAEVPLP